MRRLAKLQERASDAADHGSREAVTREVDATRKALEKCLAADGWSLGQSSTDADVDAPNFAVNMHFKRRGSDVGVISIVLKPNLSW